MVRNLTRNRASTFSKKSVTHCSNVPHDLQWQIFCTQQQQKDHDHCAILACKQEIRLFQVSRYFYTHDDHEWQILERWHSSRALSRINDVTTVSHMRFQLCVVIMNFKIYAEAKFHH